MFFHQSFAATHDALCLHPEKAGRFDIAFQLGSVREILWAFVLLEQILRHHIHTFISALCGKDSGDEKLERILMQQSGLRLGELLPEQTENLARPGFLFVEAFSSA
jgi:hypothetical protein